MRLKFGFLGACHGHRGHHVREASERPDEVELVGFYEPDEAATQRNLTEWPRDFPNVEARLFPSAQALLDSDIEVVVVEGKIFQNLDYARLALEAGKHVLLEKPAGGRLDVLSELHDLALAKGLALHMAYLFRFKPDQRELVRLVRAGALGDIFYFRAHMSKDRAWHPRLESDFHMFRGGVYFEMAGHYVDLMVALLGEPAGVKPTLAAHHGKRLHTDNTVVVHEYESCLATIDAAALHVSQRDTRRVEVYGTGGHAINAPYGESKLDVFLVEPFDNYDAGWNHLELESAPGDSSMLRELAACMRAEREPEFSLDHDFAVHRTLLKGCGADDGNAIRE